MLRALEPNQVMPRRADLLAKSVERLGRTASGLTNTCADQLARRILDLCCQLTRFHVSDILIPRDITCQETRTGEVSDQAQSYVT